MPDVKVPLPFEAYAGDEPFVFVSYAHKDGVVVFPDITVLHRQGVRIWYDEGIDPGNEWPDEVASALKRASAFLVFISSSSVQSRNVRNEINMALNRGKPFVAIYLEETELPAGLELRMGDIQAIMKWRMTEEHYSRKVLTSIPAFTVGAVRSARSSGRQTMLSPDFEFDMFISYSQKNTAWVMENLAEPLKGCRTVDGRAITVFLDVNSIRIASNYCEVAAEAINKSRVFLAVYSSDYFPSECCHFELAKGVSRDPLGARNAFVPVAIEPNIASIIPVAYNHLNWHDATQTGWFEKLIQFLGYRYCAAAVGNAESVQPLR